MTTWRARAACRGSDPALFYPAPGGESAATALRVAPVCGTCPVRAECHEWGVLHEEAGWWGGTPPAALRAERQRRGITIETSTPDTEGVAA